MQIKTGEVIFPRSGILHHTTLVIGLKRTLFRKCTVADTPLFSDLRRLGAEFDSHDGFSYLVYSRIPTAPFALFEVADDSLVVWALKQNRIHAVFPPFL